MIFRRNPEAEPSNVPLWAKIGLLGGGVVALASAVYLDKHEVKTSDQALITVMQPFNDEAIMTHIDEPEVGIALAGLVGAAVSVQSGIEILARRRDHE